LVLRYRYCIEAFRILTILLKPVLPAVAAQVEAFLKVEPMGFASLQQPLGEGHTIGPYQHLMQRVDAKQLEALFEPPAAPEPEKTVPGGEELAPTIGIYILHPWPSATPGMRIHRYDMVVLGCTQPNTTKLLAVRAHAFISDFRSFAA
jgi:hypothetical protein